MASGFATPTPRTGFKGGSFGGGFTDRGQSPVVGQVPGGFGLPNQGIVPIEFLRDILPYLTYPYDTALSLSTNAANNAAGITQQQIASGASTQNAATSAQAQLAAAQIAANSGLAQQGISSGTSASIANAGNMAALIQAAGGDRNLAARLAAQLGVQAQTSNQDFQKAYLAALSDNGLRSQLQARAWAGGLGQGQPGLGSGWQLGPVAQVQAPDVPFYDYNYAGLPQASAPTAAPITMPSFAIGGGNGGGSGSGGGAFDIGSLYSSLASQIAGSLGGFGMDFTQPGSAPGGSAPVVTNPSFGGSSGARSAPSLLAQAQAATDPATRAALLRADAGLPMLALGGQISRGRSAIVGDRGGDPANMEKVTALPGGGARVTPLGGTGSASPIRTGTPETGLAPRKTAIPDYASRTSSSAAVAAGKTAGAVNKVGVAKSPSPVLIAPPLISGQSTIQPVDQPIVGDAPITVTHPGGATVTVGGNTGQPQMNAPLNPALPAQTGLDIMNTPAGKLLSGLSGGSFSANSTFDLPEYNLKGLLGPAQLAGAFRPGFTDEQTLADIMQLWKLGGIDPQVAAQLVNRATPGWKPQQVQSVGY